MKIINKKILKQYLNFLNYYKIYVGFSDFTVKLATKMENMDVLATADVNIYEKIIEVILSQEFFKKTPEERKNILFHELLHARVLYSKKKIEEHNLIEEEHMVNDLVRGFEIITNKFNVI